MKVYIVFEDYKNETWEETNTDVLAVYDSPEKAKKFLADADTIWKRRYSGFHTMMSMHKKKDGWFITITDENDNTYEYRSLEMEVQ